MLSSITIIVIFATLPPTLMLSSFGLTLVSDFLLNTVATPTGIFLHVLQPAYAQEQGEKTDEKEDKDDEDGNQADDNDYDEEGDEDEKSRQRNSIGICCSWDERLADRILTYRIIEGEHDDDGDEDGDDEDNENEKTQRDKQVDTYDDIYNSASDLRKAVDNAINEWNTKIPNLKLSSTSSENDNDVDADIEVQFIEGLRGMAAGATMIRYDDDGFINKATILLPKAAFYIEHDSQIFAIQYDPQKLKEIATHEMGHALGLGHANFDSDLMSQRLSGKEMRNISQCDVNGVLQANQWEFVNNDTPDNPNEEEVSC